MEHVFHAVSDEYGHLHLWAESSKLLATRNKEGSKIAESNTRYHPYALDSKVLQNVVRKIEQIRSTSSFERSSLSIQLPTANNLPIPSPQIESNNSGKLSTETLDSWTVPTVKIPSENVNQLLEDLTSKPTEVKIGETVEYWETVQQFAHYFVENGHMFPHVGVEENHYISIWRAFPNQEHEFDRLEALQKSMPPLTCSLDKGGENAGSGKLRNNKRDAGQDAISVLRRTLDNFVDAKVRSELSELEVSLPIEKLDQIHREWIRSLTDNQRGLDLNEDEVTALHDEVRIWMQFEQEIEKENIRLCFRLREPEVPQKSESSEQSVSNVSTPDRWKVELLLQSESDPTLIVELSNIWDSTFSGIETLYQQLEHPKQVLMDELNRAVSVWEQVDQLTDEQTPTGIKLTTGEAETFLREKVEPLRKAGFGVILPDWWKDPHHQIGAKMVADGEDEFEGTGVTGLDIDQLQEFRWEIVLGDEKISKTELEELASIKQSLVNFGGHWVSLQEGDVREAIEIYENRDEELPLKDVLQVGTELTDADPDLPVVEKEFQGSLETLFETDVEEWIQEADTPEGFEGELRGYQKRGLGWIQYLEEQGFGGILADDMGLGKTIQILARLIQERKRDSLVGPTLVICPLSVVYNWKDEANDFAPELSVHIHHGQTRKSGEELSNAINHHDLIITTYGTARNDIEYLQQIQFHRIVLDEAQKIKNTSARRTQKIRQLSGYHRLALTGTPIENRLTELWSIMDFCNPGLLGTEKEFRRVFSKPIEKEGEQSATEQLRRLIRPFILRRTKNNEEIVDDLPEKTETKQYCPLTKQQATLYKGVADKIFKDIEEASQIERSSHILKLIGSLKAICNHPKQHTGDDRGIENRSGKLNQLTHLCNKIYENDEKALIFTQYTSMAEIIMSHIQDNLGFDILYLHGGTKKEERDEMIETFEAENSPSFFLLQIQAGGTGMNLTPANHVIHYDRWWNPAVENQATDRAYRIGQEKNVQVYKLLTKGTIEEAIDQIIEDKKELADRILVEDDSWMKNLSNDELRELVTLSERMDE